jgi:hypothetical protein
MPLNENRILTNVCLFKQTCLRFRFGEAKDAKPAYAKAPAGNGRKEIAARPILVNQLIRRIPVMSPLLLRITLSLLRRKPVFFGLPGGLGGDAGFFGSKGVGDEAVHFFNDFVFVGQLGAVRLAAD